MAASESLREKVWGTTSTASTGWIVPPVSEHDFVSLHYKTRGKALFREQLHKRVYKLLLNTYLPSMYYLAPCRAWHGANCFVFFFFLSNYFLQMNLVL
jgi:hypothetical protein